MLIGLPYPYIWCYNMDLTWKPPQYFKEKKSERDNTNNEKHKHHSSSIKPISIQESIDLYKQ